MSFPKPKDVCKSISAWLHRRKTIYTALNPTRPEIRLLHILPASQFSDPIHCQLRPASLDDETPGSHPHYEALSYVWGQDQHSLPVYVDGVPKTVTVNLYGALQYLRQPSQTRTMWIDALCIDQSNLSERTHQVGMMRHIFEGATTTIMWLGSGSELECSLAMRYLTHMAGDEDLHISPKLEPYVAVEGKNILSPEIRTGLKLVLGHAWWSRIWTVQEWVLSRHAIFQHGVHQLDAQIARHAVTAWWDHMTHASCCPRILQNDPDEDTLYTYFTNLGAINDLCSNYTEYTLPYIMSLVNNTHDATDPRGKVCGMLGLASKPYDSFISADYSLSVEAIFETATLQMVAKTGELEVFSQALNFGTRRPNLPSYVPDWTVLYSSADYNNWMCWFSNIDLYNANQGEGAGVTILSPWNILLKGVLTDEIQTIDRTVNRMSLRKPWQDWFAFLDEIFSLAGLRHSKEQDQDQELQRLAFYSTISGSLETFPNGDRLYRRALTSSNEHRARVDKWAVWLSNADTELLDEYLKDPDIDMLVDLVDVMSSRRSFVITKHGRLGWCPHTCQEGDVISVLAGGRVPFVLRKCGENQYQLIGDAYIHGIMDGEAVEALYNKGGSWDSINLI